MAEDHCRTRRKAYLLAFSFGACALIGQTELLRSVMEAADGGALAVGGVLGAWLCWIALGALAGGKAAWAKRPARTAVFFCSALCLPCLLFQVFLVGALRYWIGTPAGELVPLDILLFWGSLACGPFALLVGLSFPIMAALASGEDPVSGRDTVASSVGVLWAAEAAGSLGSGIIFTFFLAGRTSPVINVSVFGALPLIACAFLGLRPVRYGRPASLVLLVIFLLTISFSSKLDRLFLDLRWKGMGAPGEILASRWTRYTTLIFARLSGQVTVYDNGQPEFSFPDPYADASTATILLSQCPHAGRVLVVGQSAGGLAQALISAGAEEVISIHPDRVFEQTLRGFLPPGMRESLEKGSYRYICDDARAALARERSGLHRRRDVYFSEKGRAGFDLVFLNLPGPAHMNASRYYTPGFFQQVLESFAPRGGVLALTLPFGANVNYPAQTDQAAAVWSSLARVFPHLAIALNSTRCYIFAADKASMLSENIDTLMARIAPFEDQVPMLSRYLLPVYYDTERTTSVLESLERSSRGLAAHTDITPVAWFHYLRLQARLARQTQGPQSKPGLAENLLETVAAHRSAGMVAWPAIFLSLLLMYAWREAVVKDRSPRAIRWATLMSVAASGFASMGASLALIYLCQLIYGALFYQIAMITATFMAALAAGSAWSAGRATGDERGGKAVALIALLMSLAVTLPGLGAPLLRALYVTGSAAGSICSLILFYAMVMSAGILCGAMFPWAAALHLGEGEVFSGSGTASALDTADHLGAALGALTAGTLFLPALGIGYTVAGLALCEVCLALFWFSATRPKEPRP